MTADPFTRATPHYRRAQAVAARPLPLAAGEVMELPRRRLERIMARVRSALMLVALVVMLAAVWKATGRL